ncbi:MAG: hypothetical protein WCI17_05530 [bacterium]
MRPVQRVALLVEHYLEAKTHGGVSPSRMPAPRPVAATTGSVERTTAGDEEILFR